MARGASSWLLLGRKESTLRAMAKASSSVSTQMDAAPDSESFLPPPRSLAVRFLPVRAETTCGPVTNIWPTLSATMVTSVSAGTKAAPPAQGPRISEICGTTPEMAAVSFMMDA